MAEDAMFLTKPNQTKPNQTDYFTLYSDSFYKFNASDLNRVTAYKIIALARSYVSFASAIDIGCGVGNMLKACIDSGVKVVCGVDGSWLNQDMLLIPRESFYQCDISAPNLSSKIPVKHFDLTISTEVAEHIDADKADIFLDNLVSFSDVILFSAALPGHGGAHHVNEQWPSYWIEKFAARGFVPVDCIRPRIWNDKEVHISYKEDVMFFVKKECLKNYPALEKEAERPVLDIVHPDEFEDKHFKNISFRNACKNIIPAFVRAIKKRLFGYK